MSTSPNTASTPAPTHEPPSLPSSPLPKRTKVLSPTDPATIIQSTPFPPEPLDSGTLTPTPLACSANMSNLHPHPHSHSQHGHGAGHPTSASNGNLPDEILQVQLLSENARPPTKGSLYAAGHDLYAAKDVVVKARATAKVATDIAISVPVGTYGRIAPRSGLAAKHGIDTLAGVIDADYRGPVIVLLANLSDTDFKIKAGDRVAQLIVERIVMPSVVVVGKLEESVRGAGGFGSTGGFGTGVNGV